MEHQPFESWLLNADRLSAPEQARLEMHLLGCPACQNLSAGLALIEARLRGLPPAHPRPGFTQRWLERVQADRLEARARQAWLLLGGILAAGGMLGSLLTWIVVWQYGSPARLIILVAKGLVETGLQLHLFLNVLSASARAAGTFIPGPAWLSVLGAAAGLVALWMASLYRVTYRGERS
jgi:anti-sigma factor RsiW